MSFERLAPEQFDTIPGIAEPAENPLLVGHDEAMVQVASAYRAGKLHHACCLPDRPASARPPSRSISPSTCWQTR
jgi:DNA polymerase-3 subunit delta'